MSAWAVAQVDREINDCYIYHRIYLLEGSLHMQGIWDIHCHIVPGVDDGSGSMETSLAMLHREYDGGVRHIILTPHFRKAMFETERGKVEQQYNLLKERASSELPDLDLYLGCEFHVYTDMPEQIGSDPRYRMNGTDYVLLEFSEDHSAQYIEERCRSALNAGFIPIIAHGERYDAIRKDIGLIDSLHDAGAYLQVNANSILGKDGWSMKHFCAKLLKTERIDFIGSDAHNLKDRAPHIMECADEVARKYGRNAAHVLFVHNPRCVAEGNIP